MAVLPRLALALAAALAIPLGAVAQDTSGSRLTLVVPLAAGGAMDIIIRRLAPRLQEKLGKTVVVENRTGGGTVTAAVSVAKAPADGNTLLVAPAGTLTTNVALYKSLSYDPLKDFTPVAMYARVPFVLVAGASTGIASLQDLIAQAKAKPGTLSYASTGVGATPHLAGEMLRSMTGIDIAHVPYRGSPPALNDVVAGHVQLTFADPALVQELIEGGKVKAIGVSSLERMPAMPNIPTMAEAGLPAFDAVSWHMIMAPTGSPKDLIARLNAELKEFVAAPDVVAQMGKMGMIPVTTPSPEELTTFLAADIERWGKLVKQAGLAGSQ